MVGDLRINRSIKADVAASASFAEGVMTPSIDPCLSGKAGIPATSSPPLSGDVLRAYDNYTKEVAQAAGEHSVRNMVVWGNLGYGSLRSFGKIIVYIATIWIWPHCPPKMSIASLLRVRNDITQTITPIIWSPKDNIFD